MARPKPEEPRDKIGVGVLSDDDRQFIFDKMMHSRSTKRASLAEGLAKEYKISTHAIYCIFRDDKAINAAKKRAELIKIQNEIKAIEAAGEALDVQIEFIRRTDLPDGLQYLRQNAAVDIMNRANLRVKEEQNQTVSIKFDDSALGLAIGMPGGDEGSFIEDGKVSDDA